MQHNSYLIDPESHGDPAIAISSRYDLRGAQRGSPFGGLDSKISSHSLLSTNAQGRLNSWAISGPTHQNVPAFTWSDWPETSRVGQPTEWNFDWQPIKSPML